MVQILSVSSNEHIRPRRPSPMFASFIGVLDRSTALERKVYEFKTLRFSNRDSRCGLSVLVITLIIINLK